MHRVLQRARRTRTNASRPSFEALEGRQLLASLVVTNVLDSGPGSLRQAILDANAANVASKINFSIPGSGVQTLKLASALPEIKIPVTIDGTTEPGYAGLPLVAIDGSSLFASSPSGLVFDSTSSGSMVSGLAIERFLGDGILVNQATITIDSNEIGVDPTSHSAAGNGDGVSLQGPDKTSNESSARSVISNNVISANGNGIVLSAVINTLVTGNFIGTDASGRTDLGNSLDGVSIRALSTSVFVTNNVIANNGRSGIGDGGEATGQSGNTLTNNGGLVANIVVTASTNSITTSTGKIETVIYTLTNQGPHAATDVIFGAHTQLPSSFGNVLLPKAGPELTLVGAETSPGGTIVTGANIDGLGGSPFATFPSLAPGASAGVAIRVLISGSGADNLLTSVTSDQPSTNFPGSMMDTNFVATGTADLAVSALAPPPAARVGQPETFTYVITNRDSQFSTDAQFVINLGSLSPLTAFGVIVSQGVVFSHPTFPNLDIFVGDLGRLAPGASAVVSATIIPDQPGPIVPSIYTSSTSDVDPNPANNFAFSSVAATSSPGVIRVQLLPATGSISFVVLQFSTTLTVSKAQNVGNYRLTTDAGKTRVAVRSATYVPSTDSVILSLSKPLTRPGSPIKLVVGGPGTPGLTGIDGSMLVGGISISTLNRS